jgi:fibronectin type III domain protein
MAQRPHLFMAALTVLILSMLAGQTTAYAADDRTAPTTPTNLRITAMTAYTVSLAWDASRDKSGIASYTICCANVSSQVVSGSATSTVYTSGLEAGRSFTLFVVAKDNAGNWSKNSNSVSFTLPLDSTPPTKPVVTATDVGPTHASLAWSATDDGPNVWFAVFMDGSRVVYGSRATSETFSPLEPETTHTFTVQAEDFAHQLSPLSDPVTVTTGARDASDTTPPSTPGNLNTAGMQWSDGETWLFWNESTDDRTPQSIIEYRVYINDVYDSSVVGYHQTIVYGTPFSWNTYTVIAVDASGNQSAPATILVDNR